MSCYLMILFLAVYYENEIKWKIFGTCLEIDIEIRRYHDEDWRKGITCKYYNVMQTQQMFVFDQYFSWI